MLNVDDLHHYDWLQLPMWVFDTDAMAICWANDAAMGLWLASSLDELRARDFSDATPVVRARLAASMRQHLAGHVMRESWTLYPQGRPITSILLSRGLRLADGRQAILFSSEPLAASYDATMLRGTEALQHIPVRVALHRLDHGTPVMRNPAAVAAFGPVDEQAADRFDHLFVDGRLADEVLATVRRAQVHDGDALLHTLAGPCWHHVDARAVRDPVTGTAMLQLSARDISDMRAALAALEAARDAAEAANQAKSRFLTNMSHELRTPMNGVLGLTELVLASTLDERQRHFLQLAQASARSLMHTIADILDASKIDSAFGTADVRLQTAAMALRSTLQRTLAPLQAQAAQRQLPLRWAVADDLPDALLVDSERWCHVLHNLVDNALKFTDSGAVAVELHGSQRDHQGLLLACSVHDSGIGMNDEQLATAFEPFAQADDSSSRRHGGSGLGLAIARHLVGLMGGQLSATSTPGVGSVFSFTVPVALAD